MHAETIPIVFIFHPRCCCCLKNGFVLMKWLCHVIKLFGIKAVRKSHFKNYLKRPQFLTGIWKIRKSQVRFSLQTLLRCLIRVFASTLHPCTFFPHPLSLCLLQGAQGPQQLFGAFLLGLQRALPKPRLDTEIFWASRCFLQCSAPGCRGEGRGESGSCSSAPNCPLEESLGQEMRWRPVTALQAAVKDLAMKAHAYSR